VKAVYTLRKYYGDWPDAATPEALGVEPYETLRFEKNLLLNEGINEL